ncbi:hypothetical protein G6F31_016612 [Rhizopus arrhizus]|nr:hypothetical protein G6F31_016612 [Rhizopus arrhizus]
MRQMRNLLGHHRAATAGVLGPAIDPGLEEGAVDEELPAVVEKVEQGGLAIRAVEEELLAGGFPFVGGDDGGRLRGAGGLDGSGHGVDASECVYLLLGRSRDRAAVRR